MYCFLLNGLVLPILRYPDYTLITMKFLFDMFPLIAFFAGSKIFDVYVGTAALIGASVLQIGYLKVAKKPIEKIHIITLVFVLVLGGLTIFFRDPLFLQWKPTIVNWIFAVVIIVMLYVSKTSGLEYLMGSQLPLPKQVWFKLNWAWALFFVFLGLLNLYVAFYYNINAPEQQRIDTWVNFKTFGLMVLTLVFIVIQMFFLRHHIDMEQLERLQKEKQSK